MSGLGADLGAERFLGYCETILDLHFFIWHMENPRFTLLYEIRSQLLICTYAYVCAHMRVHVYVRTPVYIRLRARARALCVCARMRTRILRPIDIYGL